MLVLFATTLQTAVAAPPIRNGGNVGVGLGATRFVTGLDLKYWTGPKMSVQGVIGLYDPFTFDPDALSFGVDADVNWEIGPFVDAERFDLGMHLGLGGLYALNTDLDMVAGANVVVGINFHIDVEAVPLDIVLDYRPAVFLLDAIGPDAVDVTGSGDTYRIDPTGFGFHIRYWF